MIAIFLEQASEKAASLAYVYVAKQFEAFILAATPNFPSFQPQSIVYLGWLAAKKV